MWVFLTRSKEESEVDYRLKCVVSLFPLQFSVNRFILQDASSYYMIEEAVDVLEHVETEKYIGISDS